MTARATALRPSTAPVVDDAAVTGVARLRLVAESRLQHPRRVGVIILCGEGPLAFCSGGDQKVRGDAGYIGDDGVPRLNILDVQRKIRTLP